MEIRISTKQLEQLKSTYRTKYVDNSELYKGPKICKGVNQNLNKYKIIDLIGWYGELTRENKGIFRQEKPIGNCEDGAPIQLYTLDKTKTEKPIILIVGGVHGDEKTSIYGIYETVKFLLESNKWSRFITSNFVIQIVPCLNVYGFNNNKRNNSNDKDLNRDFIKTTQKETKALTNYINRNKDRIKIILDSHNAYNAEYLSCKQEMKYFEEYEDVAFKLNLFLNGKYDCDDKKSFLWISRSQNDGTLSDFINKNKFIGHTVESPRSLTKEIHYPNPINYEDGAEVTKDLLVNLMYIYGKMYNGKMLNEAKPRNMITEGLYDNTYPQRLYHGTTFDALENIVNTGVISAKKGQQHGETNGVNWFSTKYSENFSKGVVISISCSEEDFKDGRFKFMNNSEVISDGEFRNSIPINNRDFRIEKFLGIKSSNDFEVLYNILERFNGDIFDTINLIDKIGEKYTYIGYVPLMSVDNPIFQILLKQAGFGDLLKKEGII